MPRIDRPPPLGWRADHLSDYMERCHRQRFATFQQARPAFDRLAAIDLAWSQFGSDWISPDTETGPIFFMLFTRSHSAYRAACEHAIAGQLPESAVLTRSCIEYAAYALRMHLNSELAWVFLRRSESETARRESISAFLLKHLVSAMSEIPGNRSERFRKLYEMSIDFGAHPNEMAITGTSRLRRDGHTIKLDTDYLTEDKTTILFSMTLAARAGHLGLEAFTTAFPTYSESIGISEQISSLEDGLWE